MVKYKTDAVHIIFNKFKVSHPSGGTAGAVGVCEISMHSPQTSGEGRASELGGSAFGPASLKPSGEAFQALAYSSST